MRRDWILTAGALVSWLAGCSSDSHLNVVSAGGGAWDATQDVLTTLDAGGDENADGGAAGSSGDRDGTADTTVEREPDEGDGSQRDGGDTDGDAGGSPEDGGVPKCSPLPDGSGALTWKTTGGLALDVHLGNDEACNGSWSNGGGLLLTFFVPFPPGDAGMLPPGALSFDVSGAQPGATATG